MFVTLRAIGPRFLGPDYPEWLEHRCESHEVVGTKALLLQAYSHVVEVDGKEER